MAAARVSAQKIAQLEERIGYTFKEHARLVRALTHASATKNSGEQSHYERLEFLGDRVLGLCVAELLFDAFPNAPEGELSVRLNALVSGKTCAEIADEIALHEFIQAGTDAKQLTSKRMRSVRADVTESLIAAIHLDGGLEAAKQFVPFAPHEASPRSKGESIGSLRRACHPMKQVACALYTPRSRSKKQGGMD